MARALRHFDSFTVEGHEFMSLFLAQMAKLRVYDWSYAVYLSVCLSVLICVKSGLVPNW